MKMNKIFRKIVFAMPIGLMMCISTQSIAATEDFSPEEANNQVVLAQIKGDLPELSQSQAVNGEAAISGEESLAKGLTQAAQVSDNPNRVDATKDFLQSSVYGYLGNQMADWLNQFGNSRIQFNTDKTFNVELLLPLYETEQSLFFSQSRIQRQDEDRATFNQGFGYRYFTADVMMGLNSFYDRDLKNNNARWGLGAELGADYLKLAANGYFRLTDWRQARLSHFEDYKERPANGFDIRAEGFLPCYPYLGANVKYEKYYGDDVNLKGTNSTSNLKKDPQAYTVGLSYTPIPLLQFNVDHVMGDVSRTKAQMTLNYRFGVPLNQQLDADFVPQMQTLKGARYDFVERNNAIVMQYKQKQVTNQRLALPDARANVYYEVNLENILGVGTYEIEAGTDTIANLSLGSTGKLEGMPSSDLHGNYTIAVKVTRSDSTVDYATFDIRIDQWQSLEVDFIDASHKIVRVYFGAGSQTHITELFVVDGDLEQYISGGFSYDFTVGATVVQAKQSDATYPLASTLSTSGSILLRW